MVFFNLLDVIFEKLVIYLKEKSNQRNHTSSYITYEENQMRKYDICGMRIENRTRSLVIGFGHDLTLRICHAMPFIVV